MFRRVNNEKIGNIVSFLASKIDYLSMTKTLKLLYIIDETAMRRVGSPITWLDYKVWEMGPVAVEIYNEIKSDEKFTYKGEQISLDSYIHLEKKKNKKRGSDEVYIKPNKDFDNGIFNKFEWNLIEEIQFKFGARNSEWLIDYLHEEDTLWHRAVQENNLKEHFNSISKKSNHSIDFHDLLVGNPILLMAAKSSYEAMEFSNNIGNS